MPHVGAVVPPSWPMGVEMLQLPLWHWRPETHFEPDARLPMANVSHPGGALPLVHAADSAACPQVVRALPPTAPGSVTRASQYCVKRGLMRDSSLAG